MNNRVAILFLLLALAGTGFAWPEARSRELAAEKLPAPFEELKSCALAMTAPGPGDWLASHEESGQSYQAYITSKVVRPTDTLTTIYVQPVGRFTAEQLTILDRVAASMRVYFGVPVTLRKPLAEGVVPASARRKNPYTGQEQWRTGHFLYQVLKPHRPADALALIAFTSGDLYPSDEWNFVYGQASLRQRVGVWSIARFGDPAESAEAYRLCLRRSIQTATHEMGHMLTIRHCLAYNCNMNGVNNRTEGDSRSLLLCPSCLAKLCWNTEQDPAKRYHALLKLYTEYGLKDAARMTQALGVLEAAADE